MIEINVQVINKFIETIGGNVTVVEMKVYPKYEYEDGDFVQKNTYAIKYEGQMTQYLANQVETFFGIEMVWGDIVYQF